MDVASTLREQYLVKRAQEIAVGRANEVITQELRKAESLVESLRDVREKSWRELSAASAAADSLRDLGKSVEIDLSDESFGETLNALAKTAVGRVFEGLGFRTGPAPAAPPTHGTRSEKPRVAPATPPPPGTSNGVPKPPDAPVEPAPAAPAAGKRLVKAADGGRVSAVTPRAARALAAAKGGAKDEHGVTHRADALVDESGRAIPVDEQIVVDGEPPEPGALDPEDRGGVVRTHPAEDDDDSPA